jgi:polyisoprenyl-teichoic acid--peptidoglycan teichoic acid transferase
MAEPSVRDPSASRLRSRDPVPADHARPMRQTRKPPPDEGTGGGRDVSDGGHSDRRRLLAAIGSSVLPGSGQLLNGRLRPALLFGVPTLAVVAAAWLVAQSDRPTMLLAKVIAPSVLGVLLILNAVILAWRAVALLHAFLDRRYPLRPGRLGAVGLAALLAATVLPHAIAWSYGTTAQTMFGQIFAGSAARSVSTAPPPLDGERLNVLLIGIDSGPGRTEALTDSMIVVSLDPIGRTVSMVSIPRDLASVPLGNGNVFGPKINSLMSWAEAHPTEFPHGGVRALEDAVGALLGIPIHYYARVNLHGFVAMVDAVGGVDVSVRKALADPNYGGFGVGPGWSIEPGAHHLDGANALAYARIRKSTGESDFTRAARQQEVLVALRDRAVGAGLLFSLPRLLPAIGATVRTDLPQDRLPQLAALAEQIDASSTTKVVLGSPLIKSGGSTQYGSIFVPVPAKIQAMAKVVFGPPGADPAWPLTGATGVSAGASVEP